MKPEINNRKNIMQYLAAVGAVKVETDDTVTEVWYVEALSDNSTLIIPNFIQRMNLGSVLASDVYGINRIVMHGDLEDISLFCRTSV